MAKNRNLTESQLANLKTDAGPGRPKGRKNFKTLYYEAIERIAQSQGITGEEFEVKMIEQAARKGFNGDVRFYQDTIDRVHGKAQQNIDHTSGGQPITVNVVSFKDESDNDSP